MPCSTKLGIGAPSGISAVLGFISLILGIVVMTSTIPVSKCGPTTKSIWKEELGITPAEKDAIDTGLIYISWPLVLGGVLAVIGGLIGLFTAIKAHKCGICAGAAIMGAAAGFVITGALAAMVFAAVFGELCDDFTCGTQDTCTQSIFGTRRSSACAAPDTCCSGCRAICQSDNDWACGVKSKKVAATVFGFLCAIIVLLASAMACAAGCCCPDKFNELKESGPGGASNSPTVIGQPVNGGC